MFLGFSFKFEVTILYEQDGVNIREQSEFMHCQQGLGYKVLLPILIH